MNTSAKTRIPFQTFIRFFSNRRKRSAQFAVGMALRPRGYWTVFWLVFLTQTMLVIEAQAQTLNWRFKANYNAGGESYSCSSSFSVPSTGGSKSFKCGLGTATASVNISNMTFHVGGFGSGNFFGASCVGNAGGSSSITRTSTTYFTVGKISGSGNCTYPEQPSFPITVTGTYDASAPLPPVDPTPIVAQVSSLSGDVRISVNNKETRLTTSTPIPSGAKLITGANGTVKITLVDGSGSIILGANSAFQFESPEKCGLTFSENCFLLYFGEIRAQVEALLNRRFRVRTSVAVAGVRGTDFSVSHKSLSLRNTTTVRVFTGSVELIGNNGKLILVRAGQTRSISTVNYVPYILLME